MGVFLDCVDLENFFSVSRDRRDRVPEKTHTYALEEVRKLKAVIRGIPADFTTDDIKFHLCSQGFPVYSVHRIDGRDGSPLWLVPAVLPKTKEVKLFYKILNQMCGFRVSEWRPRAKSGRELKFAPKPRLNTKWPTQVPAASACDDRNFLALVTKNPTRSSGGNSRPKPAPLSAAPEPRREVTRRGPPALLSYLRSNKPSSIFRRKHQNSDVRPSNDQELEDL
ncbi:hypothetical protein EVAR_14721_1 [Eumeta japonica]|uniref:Uncharacterized protein n=1 Tax=Eumeta variegata TaxID=151549 RepID=A0A4C1TWC0_EUMVA|nr:hypothetical protein EVAR_14721_1 [Eumeta japonica]